MFQLSPRALKIHPPLKLGKYSITPGRGTRVHCHRIAETHRTPRPNHPTHLISRRQWLRGTNTSLLPLILPSLNQFRGMMTSLDGTANGNGTGEGQGGEPVDILLIGLGSVGTFYGYMLEKVSPGLYLLKSVEVVVSRKK